MALHPGIYNALPHKRFNILTSHLFYSTTATISKEYLVPRAPSKKIDFCLHIEPRNSDAIEDEVALWTLKQYAGDLEPCSINHTDFRALAFRPVTTAIETKREGGDDEEARLQIGVWQAAQWKMLHFLLAKQGKVAALQSLPFLPAVMIRGHHWAFAATSRKDKKTIFWAGHVFGSTENPIGVYKIVRVIQELATWSRDEYWPWYKENVLDSAVGNAETET